MPNVFRPVRLLEHDQNDWCNGHERQTLHISWRVYFVNDSTSEHGRKRLCRRRHWSHKKKRLVGTACSLVAAPAQLLLRTSFFRVFPGLILSFVLNRLSKNSNIYRDEQFNTQLPREMNDGFFLR